MATNVPQSAPGSTYRLLDSGIHEIALNSVAPGAVVEFFAHLNAVFDGKARADPPVLIILDFSAAGLPSLSRLMTGGRDLIARHPDRPSARYALIVHGTARYIAPALEHFIQRYRSTNQARSFLPGERAQAEAWLLRDADKPDMG